MPNWERIALAVLKHGEEVYTEYQGKRIWFSGWCLRRNPSGLTLSRYGETFFRYVWPYHTEFARAVISAWDN